jgi:hypothetical protein
MAALMVDAVHSTGHPKPWDTDPFKFERIVSSICEYAGPGHWLFLAGINKLYMKLYGDVSAQTLDGYDANNEPVKIVCTPQMTLGRAMFASGSRFEWALGCGIKNGVPALLRNAGLYAADPNTLLAARNLGLPMGEDVLIGGVLSGSVAR